MQLAIDSAKRAFDIDIPREIKRIKRVLNVRDSHGNGNLYPEFWKIVQPGWNDKDKDGNSLINPNIDCPMNQLCKFRAHRNVNRAPTIPIKQFFVHYELKESRRKCLKIEEIIKKYSFNLYKYNIDSENDNESYFLLRDDFEQMIEDIRSIHISNNYLGFMSFLIDRAMKISPAMKANRRNLSGSLENNRSLLIKTLYDVAPEQFLQCFAGNLEHSKSTPSKNSGDS